MPRLLAAPGPSPKQGTPTPGPAGCRLRRRLLAWYARHARRLPWRGNRDPYAVLVSEVMLQQTQVARVAQFYSSFLARYPTLEDLAAASPDAVRESWEGLGYYARARNLHAAARHVVATAGGRLPPGRADLPPLPGTGRRASPAPRPPAHHHRRPSPRPRLAHPRPPQACRPPAPPLGPRRRARAAAPPRRLEPGPHGPRRDHLHRPRPPMPTVSGARGLPL